MSARESIAYMKGLLDAKEPEDKTAHVLFKAMLSALEALAEENDALRAALGEQQSAVNDLYTVCDELDADLSDVEERMGIGDEDDFAPFDEEYKEFACPECGLHFFCHSSMIDEDGAKCPDCGCKVPAEETFDEGEDDGVSD